jgi:hypothetical protein
MKANFMTTRDETPFVEPDAALTAAVQRDISQDLADSHRLQAASNKARAESYRLQSASLSALARYERAMGNRIFGTQDDFNGYIDHLKQQAASYEADAAKIEHEIATGAK